MADQVGGGAESVGGGPRCRQEADGGVDGRPLPTSLPIPIPRVTVSSASDLPLQRSTWRFAVGSVRHVIPYVTGSAQL